MLCGLATVAEGAVIFSFATDRSSYTVAPGGKVAVEVFLEEHAEPGDVSLLVGEGGLFSAGLKLVPLSPIPEQAVTVDSDSDIMPSPAFTGGALPDLAPLTLLLADGIFAEPGPAGQVVGDGIRRVHLATFRFTAGDMPGQSTIIQVADYDDYGKSSDTLTWWGTELDNLIAPATFTITTVVPEPGTLLPLLAAVALLRRGARRTGRLPWHRR